MAVDSTKVIVPGGATLYFGALGATLSTFNGTASPGTAWTDAGYLTEDGATFDAHPHRPGHHRLAVARPGPQDPAGADEAGRMVLREWSPANIKFVLGGGTVTAGTGAVAWHTRTGRTTSPARLRT